KPEKIICEVAFATYRRAVVSDCKVPFYPDNPETYSVPSEFGHFMEFDTGQSCLKIIASVQKKEVRQIFERDTISEGEYGIFNSAYRLCDQLRAGFVREPHHKRVILDFSQSEYIDNNKEIDGTNAKITALKRKIGDDIYSIT